jgi:hypothetical protein
MKRAVHTSDKMTGALMVAPQQSKIAELRTEFQRLPAFGGDSPQGLAEPDGTFSRAFQASTQ